MSKSKIYLLIFSLFLIISLFFAILYYSQKPIDNTANNSNLSVEEKANSDIILDDNLQDKKSGKESNTQSKELNNKINKPINILSFGDMMLDRYIRKFIDNNGATALFTNIPPILKNKDMVVANLEGSITNFNPKPLNPNNVSFTFDPKIVPELKKLGFTHFSLANNHSLDFGAEGVRQTKEFLDQENLKYFGDYKNKTSLSYIESIENYKVGLIGYHELFDPDTTSVINEIKNIRDKTDFIIVYPHWGAEYQTKFSKSQQDKAHQFIEAGADAVLGAHPHVIQPIEIYKDKVIFYSLGNFVFDQTFSQNTQRGLAINIKLENENINYEIITLESRNLVPYILSNSGRETILSNIANNSTVSEEIKTQIKSGSFDLNR
jgi:poly-gamma-glutamate synthesis protein (capsule biosynthesis protein)